MINFLEHIIDVIKAVYPADLRLNLSDNGQQNISTNNLFITYDCELNEEQVGVVSWIPLFFKDTKKGFSNTIDPPKVC